MTPRPKEEVPQRFSKLVLGVMRRKGMSLRTVAARAGLDPSTLSKIILRQQGLPTDAVIRDIARALELDNAAELFVAARRVPADKYYATLLRLTSVLTAEEKIKVLRVAQKLASRHRKTP